MARKATVVTAVALSLFPLGQPLLLGTPGITTATTAILLHAPAALAQDASSVAKIAKAITVRVEGSTQGSGVIVKREGNSYTVLTAWHVVSGNRPGEEVGIITPDGKQYRLDQGSIQRLGQVDMAVLTFNTPGTYDVASIGDVKNVSSGNPIFVSGFPLPTSSVPTSIWRFLKGDVIANANVAIPDGYQLLYSNPTLPGMSGGSVLNSQGQLVGIHGRSEKDDQVSMRTGKAVSTGTNQAVPITYYRQFNSDRAVVASRSQAVSADDYLAKAKSITRMGLGPKVAYQKRNMYIEKSLQINPYNENAYLLLAILPYDPDIIGDKIVKKRRRVDIISRGLKYIPSSSKLNYSLGKNLGSLAIAVEQDIFVELIHDATVRGEYSYPDFQGEYWTAARNDRRSKSLRLKQLIALETALRLDPTDPSDSIRWEIFGVKKFLDDNNGALSELNIMIANGKRERFLDELYWERAKIHKILGEHSKACRDYFAYIDRSSPNTTKHASSLQISSWNEYCDSNH